MDIAQFRIDFPEFADNAVYTDGMISFWDGIAQKSVDVTRWGDLYTQGVSLFVAHNIALQARNVAGSGSGGAGFVAGAIASKSIGDVSVSYDNAIAKLDNAGQWALTIYGQQYLQLARMIGAGAVQL